MYLVSEVLKRKGAQVVTIGPRESAQAAAALMNQHRIGSLVVTEGERPVGIVTERDILTKIVAPERPPRGTPVADIMTARILTCAPGTTLDEVRQTMRERRIRHVPVVESGRLVGMISIGDINIAEAQTLTETIGYLEAYISR